MLTGITGTQFTTIHSNLTNQGDHMRPSRLEIYLEPDQRSVPKTRFGNTQHQSLSTNDLDASVKPSPPTKRLPFGDSYTHLPNI